MDVQRAQGSGVSRLLFIALLIATSATLAGCEVIGGIFKAGMWTGALFIVILIVLVGFVAVKIRG